MGFCTTHATEHIGGTQKKKRLDDIQAKPPMFQVEEAIYDLHSLPTILHQLALSA